MQGHDGLKLFVVLHFSNAWASDGFKVTMLNLSGTNCQKDLELLPRSQSDTDPLLICARRTVGTLLAGIEIRQTPELSV